MTLWTLVSQLSVRLMGVFSACLAQLSAGSFLLTFVGVDSLSAIVDVLSLIKYGGSLVQNVRDLIRSLVLLLHLIKQVCAWVSDVWQGSRAIIAWYTLPTFVIAEYDDANNFLFD